MQLEFKTPDTAPPSPLPLEKKKNSFRGKFLDLKSIISTPARKSDPLSARNNSELMVNYSKEFIKTLKVIDDNIFALSREDGSLDLRYISDLKFKGNL